MNVESPRSRCVALFALSPLQAEPIRIDAGLVEGVTLASGVRAWLGVPLAAPPVRELRWRPPQPVPAWNGVLHADRQAPMCLQPVRSRTMNHYFGNEATSEDCLYLNVWAPAQRGRKAAGDRVDLRRRFQRRLGEHGELLGRGPRAQAASCASTWPTVSARSVFWRIPI